MLEANRGGSQWRGNTKRQIGAGRNATREYAICTIARTGIVQWSDVDIVR